MENLMARVLGVCLLFVVTCLAPLPACGLDKKSDVLLDKLNDNDSRPSPHRAAPSSKLAASVPVVSRSLRSDVHMVLDKNKEMVEVYGQTSSSSDTEGHANTIETLAWNMARSGDYHAITMQRSWAKATSLPGASKRIPDLIGLRRDGRVDAFEIKSRSDIRKKLERRLEEGMNTLPPEHRGEFDVLEADPGARGGWFDE